MPLLLVNPMPCFEYSLAATMVVSEVDNLGRVTFGGNREIRQQFTFNSTDVETCKNVVVSIKVSYLFVCSFVCLFSVVFWLTMLSS